MPGLDYTQNYRLRIPQSGDRRTLADFQLVFRDNFLTVDTQLKAHDNRMNALESGGVINGSGDAESVDGNVLARLQTRLSALELKSVTGVRKDDNGLWYAYNKNGQDVGGPYRFGSIDGMTLNEYLNAVTDDSVTYQEPLPIAGTELGPNITLNGLLDAVSDDSVTYQNPTPLVDE